MGGGRAARAVGLHTHLWRDAGRGAALPGEIRGKRRSNVPPVADLGWVGGAIVLLVNAHMVHPSDPRTTTSSLAAAPLRVALHMQPSSNMLTAPPALRRCAAMRDSGVERLGLASERHASNDARCTCGRRRAKGRSCWAAGGWPGACESHRRPQSGTGEGASRFGEPSVGGPPHGRGGGGALGDWKPRQKPPNWSLPRRRCIGAVLGQRGPTRRTAARHVAPGALHVPVLGGRPRPGTWLFLFLYFPWWLLFFFGKFKRLRWWSNAGRARRSAWTPVRALVAVLRTTAAGGGPGRCLRKGRHGANECYGRIITRVIQLQREKITK